MPDDELAHVLRTLGLGADAEVINAGDSGSGVYRVQADGNDAVLKVTAAGSGRRNARRELGFYRTLADQVPVTTPRLLRYADHEDFTALLLSAHRPALSAREWDRPAWLKLARQLGALHSIRPPDKDPWVDQPGHRQVPYRPPVDLAEKYWSRTEAAGSIRSIVDAPDTLAQALRAMPDCFLHGDCHVENLLREGNEIVWTDWQVAGIGSAAGELAFLWSRAHADGADIPYDAMMREYLTHRGVDPAPLRRAVVAAEIDLLLFAWPNHVAHLAGDERHRLTYRLLQLIDVWHTS